MNPLTLPRAHPPARPAAEGPKRHPAEALARAVLALRPGLTVRSLILGANPVAGAPREPWQGLPAVLPGSEIIGLDAAGGPANVETVIVAARAGTAIFHDTVAPMCGSLYEPVRAVLERFEGLDVAMPAGCGGREVPVTTVDAFTEGLRPIHFLQADLQGGEADALMGAAETLADCVAVVSEVEFVRLYRDQPLFGAVDALLAGQGFEFRAFLGLQGRPLKTRLGPEGGGGAAHLWADGLWVRRPEDLVGDAVLRLAVTAALYGQWDLAMAACERHDAPRLADVLEDAL